MQYIAQSARTARSCDYSSAWLRPWSPLIRLVHSYIMKIVVTGASGLLGRSLLRLLSLASPDEYEVIGLGYSRAEPPLRKLDLLDAAATEELLRELAPDIVVHCAAERFPDRAAADPERTRVLNVDVCSRLAAVCASCGASLVYLSTDYVFDGGVKTGVLPPYPTDAPPSPVNFYGETKREGEKAVLAVPGCHPVVVRVPVLYGYDQPSLDESASLVVAEVLRKHPASTKVDHWGVRFPTAVDDVSKCLRAIIDAKRHDSAALCGIFHCSSPEPATKYEQALLMAEILGVPATHLAPDPEPPAGAPRPQNTQLETAPASGRRSAPGSSSRRCATASPRRSRRFGRGSVAWPVLVEIAIIENGRFKRYAKLLLAVFGTPTPGFPGCHVEAYFLVRSPSGVTPCARRLRGRPGSITGHLSSVGVHCRFAQHAIQAVASHGFCARRGTGALRAATAASTRSGGQLVLWRPTAALRRKRVPVSQRQPIKSLPVTERQPILQGGAQVLSATSATKGDSGDQGDQEDGSGTSSATRCSFSATATSGRATHTSRNHLRGGGKGGRGERGSGVSCGICTREGSCGGGICGRSGSGRSARVVRVGCEAGCRAATDAGAHSSAVARCCCCRRRVSGVHARDSQDRHPRGPSRVPCGDGDEAPV